MAKFLSLCDTSFFLQAYIHLNFYLSNATQRIFSNRFRLSFTFYLTYRQSFLLIFHTLIKSLIKSFKSRYFILETSKDTLLSKILIKNIDFLLPKLKKSYSENNVDTIENSFMPPFDRLWKSLIWMIARRREWKWEHEQLSLAVLGSFLLPKLIQLLRRPSDVVATGFRPIRTTELISISTCWSMRRCMCQAVYRPARIAAKRYDAYG